MSLDLSHPPVLGALPPQPTVDDFSDRTFGRITALMYETVGLSMNETKKSLVASRLAPRIQRLGLRGYDDYLALLLDEHEAAEFQMAVDLLTTNETYFFREPHHFELLEKELIARHSRAPLALWSAASSFGDEAYSTAMLLTELQKSGQIGPDWSILATDISHRVLLSAKEGVYPVDRLRHVSPERLKRHCLRGDGPAEGQVMVKEEVRSRVRFGQLNLCRPITGIGPFDIVFLRNVLIYFDAETKRAVIDRVAATIKPGGILFMGTAEGRAHAESGLEPLVPGAFRKPVKR
ncbi:CheR family methyltransferase [Leptothrix discophora]|uniref:Chemotaxis protein methyltransferase n=1 Tax=Leptothrix discophora TaxID=89 RepID=A0ABT9G0P4_LEPDI|nr:protein-glutamate O-methyltransferase CheR [Leptothrix discophora]MDP4299981.1 protein-glutamate O-methyltransferase CheR [Leptothrix discophora]